MAAFGTCTTVSTLSGQKLDTNSGKIKYPIMLEEIIPPTRNFLI
jgi:hypothetical protein